MSRDNPGRRSEMIHEGRDESGLLNEDLLLRSQYGQWGGPEGTDVAVDGDHTRREPLWLPTRWNDPLLQHALSTPNTPQTAPHRPGWTSTALTPPRRRHSALPHQLLDWTEVPGVAWRALVLFWATDRWTVMIARDREKYYSFLRPGPHNWYRI
ncbi:hypothetical protein B0H17DRAFT_1142697 [Mycena rosella]|uniref:Uncharacterized protein n=1 Tax=Mycena rosella TaxID=1033263 RepID=A0AAD7CY66_MYCRO|nr:hypothetical protein B0H17DRAFT_1142697 [Mycena rosella]